MNVFARVWRFLNTGGKFQARAETNVAELSYDQAIEAAIEMKLNETLWLERFESWSDRASEVCNRMAIRARRA